MTKQEFLDENKMAEIAQMYGKALGETFFIKELPSKQKCRAKFTEKGLAVELFFDNDFLTVDEFLGKLIAGRMAIVDDI